MADPKALTEARYHQVEDCDPISELERAAVRHLVAGNAENVDEAIEFMKMLGVHPSQAEELVCTVAPSFRIP